MSPGPDRAAPDPFAPLASIERALERYVETLRVGPALREAIAYSFLSGGKRLRPVLAWHSALAAGGRGEDALPACVALELVHCFSLVHDDLPAMDDDDLRRGIPTLHKHAGEAMAILAGDAMMTLAFEPLVTGVVDPRLAEPERAGVAIAMVRELIGATSSMIVGQVYDSIPGAVERAVPDAHPSAAQPAALQRVRTIHENKTGALIHAACVLGGMSASLGRPAAAGPALRLDASPLLEISRYARSVGLMFQIVDDVIDVTQTAEEAGKRTGKDQQAGKRTYPLALAAGEPLDRGVERSRAEIACLRHEALDALRPLGQAGSGLAGLCDYLASRTR